MKIADKVARGAKRALLAIGYRASTAAKPPVITQQPAGDPCDALDRLNFVDHFEDPDQYERVMRQIHADAREDPELTSTLEAAYLDEDRKQAFRRYLESGAAQAMSDLLARMSVDRSAAICDYGCGPGQLGWALSQLGHERVSWMDPNDRHLTGTGFLRELLGGEADIVNDFGAWAARANRYDAVVSKGTIHHWQHIPGVAIGLRRALKPGGLWCATSEFFAHSSSGLVASLENHPLWRRYMTYEWPYPAPAYVDLVESAGFELHAVIPLFYKGNAFVDFDRPLPPSVDLAALEAQVDGQLTGPGGTVERFWEEVDHFRRRRDGVRVWSHPQVMIFRRVAVA